MQISEYVTIGHPDKVADYVSEYILDRLLEQDTKTRYALEVQLKDNYVTLAGEVTTRASADYERWTKEAIADIGYTAKYARQWGAENALNAEEVVVACHISTQSNDIAQGVNADGWGDQGIMFGLAINSPQTNYMPIDYYLAKMLGQKLFYSGIGGLDIKTQVALDKNKVIKVIVAIPLLDGCTKAVEEFTRKTIGGDYELVVNGTGAYVKHSSMGDCGTTGRKLAVDFYGGNCAIGGGSPWTKDGTKADLALNLYARQLALDYVKRTNEPYAKCSIGCCIGRSDIEVTMTDASNNELESYSRQVLPRELIERYELDKPIFSALCRDGLFSRL